jgi:ribosomal protein S18 acetylase RimI-like enzyme
MHWVITKQKLWRFFAINDQTKKNGGQMNIILQPFTKNHAIQIASWSLSANETKAWAGHNATFPLPPAQFDRWHEEPGTHPFIAHHNNLPVAYGQLWVDLEEQDIELARIIVHPSHRGIGMGRQFVTALVHQATTYGLKNIFIRVLPNNDPAIRCYQSSGFVRVSKDEEDHHNQGQPHPYVWLKFNT